MKYTLKNLLADACFALLIFAAVYAGMAWASTESEETKHIPGSELP